VADAIRRTDEKRTSVSKLNRFIRFVDFSIPRFQKGANLMAQTVRRDPFARGAFRRECKPDGECHWCGQHRRRLFTYIWVRDDSLCGRPGNSHQHQARNAFCNFECFESSHS
jgi:hypothetical protein